MDQGLVIFVLSECDNGGLIWDFCVKGSFSDVKAIYHDMVNFMEINAVVGDGELLLIGG